MTRKLIGYSVALWAGLATVQGATVVSSATSGKMMIDTRAHKAVMTFGRYGLTQAVRYSGYAWDTRFANETATVTADGVTLVKSTGEGQVMWRPERVGLHTLYHFANGTRLTRTYDAEGPTVRIVCTQTGTAGSMLCQIDCDMPDATIYYTVDGTEPTTASRVYGGPFQLTLPNVKRLLAVAVVEGYPMSQTAYPIVSVVEDVSVASSATSDKMVVDTRAGKRPIATDHAEDITYSNLWSGDATATATIAVNGGAVKTATGEGVHRWPLPSKVGNYVFTHTTKKNGAQVGDVLTATFVVASHEIAIDDGTGGAVVVNVTARPRYPWNGKVDVSMEIGDGLAAHWPFDGSMRDVSGNGHNLSVGLGQPVLTEGRGGLPDTAYYFDGNSYLHLREEKVFAVSNNFSIALWFKTSVAMSSYGSSKTFWNPGNDVIFAEFNDYKAVGVGVRVGTDGVAVVEHGGFYRPTVLAYKPQSGMSDGWHHVVVTVKDNGGEVLYVDGQYVGTAEINSESLTEKHGGGTKAFWFNDEQSGVGGGQWGHYTGSVDDVRVYDHALSGDEVAMLYCDVLAVKPCIVSLAAKDLAGGTNLPMRTVWRADGTAVNPAGESVMPGTHRWVWDADADLPDGFRCDRVAVEVKSE